MGKILTLAFTVCCLTLSACSYQPQNPTKVVVGEKYAKYKVNFKLPPNQKWDLVSVEQDANGYAKSYRSASAKGLSADQSFYINFGRNIKTPLLESMHEVISSIESTGCKRSSSKIMKLEKNTLLFSVSAEQCRNDRRAMWQIFKVFNMPDGQYSIVYSANPRAVPAQSSEQMKKVVQSALISPIK